MAGADFKSTVNNDKIVIRDYKFSDDETKILISTDIQRIYRTSIIANYYVWDIKNKVLLKLLRIVRPSLQNSLRMVIKYCTSQTTTYSCIIF